ncbi:4Fe-4S binding protein [Methanococcus maripaludis]|uniref:4Fe-4S binding protein n=1 Tax=Methanococcus maripaludis TaxID=39152 RepID=UPI003143BC8B
MKVNYSKCGYCGACVGVCKSMAIELIENKLYIEEEKCNNCTLCAVVCPVNALEE